MMRIQNGTNEVKHAISDIANASTEQRNASHDIARNVEHIAQMAETNAAAIQQAAAVASHWSRLPTACSRQWPVSGFLIGGDGCPSKKGRMALFRVRLPRHLLRCGEHLFSR